MLKRSRSTSKRFFSLLLWRRLNANSWCKRLLSTSIVSLCGVLTLSSITIAVAPNAQLQDWRFSPEFGQLEFTLSAVSQPKVFFLSQPERLVIDLPGTKLGFVPTQQNYSGAIQRIRLSQLNASVTRIVLDLAPGTPINPSQVLVQPTSPTSWVLRPFAKFANNIPQGIYAPQPPNNNIPQPIYAPQPPNNNIPQPIYAPQPPNNNIQQPIYAPQPPNNTAPIYTPEQPGIITPPGTSLPSTNTNIQQQQPFVSVPPLTINNTSPIPGSILPPANFPNPSGGIINTPPLITPNNNFPTTIVPTTTVPTSPNTPITNTNPNDVVPWGQNLPTQR
ncbi:MAG: AMIN domain-containing protein [Calothrix sp. FI2-JRJ7]|nr:AMIN domain-containing protein [Calothrix sp. FI2-JRJ7]